MAFTGWMIAASRCQHLEDAASKQAVYAINLVRPYRSSAVDDNIPDVTQLFGELLFPWRWAQDAVWWAWGSKLEGGVRSWIQLKSARRNDPGDSPLRDDDVEKLREEIQSEITGTGCNFPFSDAIEHFLGPRSLTHSLAQMTVWPELMSRRVLGQSLFIEVDKDELVDIQEVVCFPELTCRAANGTLQTYKPLPNTLLAQPVHPGKKLPVTVGFDARDDVQFLCWAAQAHEAGLQTLTLQPSQGRADRLALNEELYAMLLPAALLRHWLATPDGVLEQLLRTDAPLRLAMGDALWHQFGYGQDIGHNASAGTTSTNILVFLAPAENTAAIQKLTARLADFRLEQASPRASLQVAIKQLAGQGNQSRNAWNPVQESMQTVMGAAADDFPASWRQAAQALLDPQQAAELYGPWLDTVLSPHVLLKHEPGDPGPDKDLQELSAQLKRPGRVKLIHWLRGRLAGVGATQWQAAHDILAELTQGTAPGAIDPALKAALTAATLDQIRLHLTSEAGSTAGFDSLMTLRFPKQDEAPDEDGVELQVAKRVEAWVERAAELLHHQTDANARRSMDRGLRLSFINPLTETALAATDADEVANRLRGYAIALCAGVELRGVDGRIRWQPDVSRAAWLTDTAAQFSRLAQEAAADNGRTTVMDWLEDAGGGPAWMHETVGATKNDGESSVEFEFAGHPLASGISDRDGKLVYDRPGGAQASAQDLDGFKTVNFAWHQSRQLPPLGFGLSYIGVAGAIDNAGGIVDPGLRAKPSYTALKPASEIDAFAAQQLDARLTQYRCNEAPGAPTLVTPVPERMLELSDETRAAAYQRSQARRKSEELSDEKVAVLALDTELFPEASSAVTLALRPPGATPAFVERWLATDRVLLSIFAALKSDSPGSAETYRGLVSDPAFKDLPESALEDFVRRFGKQQSDAGDGMRQYHPAVAALGVEVWAPDMTEKQRAAAIVAVPISQLLATKDGLQMADTSSFEALLKITAVAGTKGKGRAPVPKVVKKGRTVTVSLPQGGFARIRLHSLVAKRFVGTEAHPDGRFATGAHSGEFTHHDDEQNKDRKEYVRCGFRDLWFETLPAWNTDLAIAEKQLLLEGPVVHGDRVTRANEIEATLDLSAAPLADAWAAWLKGVQLECHEWHWTGYPVRFPDAGSTFTDWQRVMAGTQTYRASEYIPFDSDVDESGSWTLDSDGRNRPRFYRHALSAGRRPARYTAVLARPVIRFRRWMRGQPASIAKLEQSIWGSGCFVAGRGAAGGPERLPVPALRQAIPLTATYNPAKPSDRLPNGVLLVLDEALRRTDDLSLTGGLGETLEVDVLETRVPGFAELGVNPLMHGNPRPALAAGIEALEPFGLTYDIGRNPKVGQTGLVIYPTNADGRWMMASVRLRRAMLPETDLDSWIPRSRTNSYQLHHRTEGTEKVPPDFAVDLPEGQFELEIDYGGAEPSKILLPQVEEGPLGATRYVVSWHRDRWGDADEPTWRCQVLAQHRVVHSGDKTHLAWRTVKKLGCLAQQGSRLAPGVPGISSELWLRGVALDDPRVAVRRMRLSDYTQSRWLPFIGSFGMARPPASQDFVFRRTGDAIILQSTGGEKAPPPLRGLLDGLPERHDSVNAVDDPCFDLVLVSRSPGDVTRSDLQDGGQLVSVLWSRNGVLRPMQEFTQPLADLDGCSAHVVRMQRITSLSNEERARLRQISSFSDLLKEAFPDTAKHGEPHGKTEESRVRFLPEYLGPIPIVKG